MLVAVRVVALTFDGLVGAVVSVVVGGGGGGGGVDAGGGGGDVWAHAAVVTERVAAGPAFPALSTPTTEYAYVVPQVLPESFHVLV